MASTTEHSAIPSEDKAATTPAMDTKEEARVEEGSILEKAHTAATQYNATMSLDPVAERKLVWKLDLRILPVLAVMYLFNALDKGRGLSCCTEQLLGLTLVRQEILEMPKQMVLRMTSTSRVINTTCSLASSLSLSS